MGLETSPDIVARGIAHPAVPHIRRVSMGASDRSRGGGPTPMKRTSAGRPPSPSSTGMTISCSYCAPLLTPLLLSLQAPSRSYSNGIEPSGQPDGRAIFIRLEDGAGVPVVPALVQSLVDSTALCEVGPTRQCSERRGYVPRIDWPGGPGGRGCGRAQAPPPLLSAEGPTARHARWPTSH